MWSLRGKEKWAPIPTKREEEKDRPGGVKWGGGGGGEKVVGVGGVGV